MSKTGVQSAAGQDNLCRSLAYVATSHGFEQHLELRNHLSGGTELT